MFPRCEMCGNRSQNDDTNAFLRSDQMFRDQLKIVCPSSDSYVDSKFTEDDLICADCHKFVMAGDNADATPDDDGAKGTAPSGGDAAVTASGQGDAASDAAFGRGDAKSALAELRAQLEVLKNQ